MKERSARAILFHKGKPSVGMNGKLFRLHPSELIGHNLVDPHVIFMGLKGKRPIFAANLAEDNLLTLSESFQSLRACGRAFIRRRAISCGTR